MFAYVDESGNTGANLFDEAQPDFFTGALITKGEFDVVYGPAVRTLCADNGLDALHASVIGLEAIETVAKPLLKIIRKANARFFISRVEKRYLLAAKLFDTFFDSGENPAVNWAHYNMRPLRLTLCFKVASVLTEDIARDFWAMLMAKNEKSARAVIPGICDALLARTALLPDPRSREIAAESLEWTRDHPEALDIFIPGRQAKNGHMPNIVAFANLLEGLDHFSKRWRRPVKKILHDRQSQFEGTLAEWHRLYSTAPHHPIELPGETYVFQKVVGSTFEFSASSDSPGIQLADIVLWLFQQYLAGKLLPENAVKLLEFAMGRAWQNDFSYAGVGRAVEAQLRALDRPLSPEAMARAMLFRDELERRRREAMAQYKGRGETADGGAKSTGAEK